MARFHSTPNGLVPFTAQEELQADKDDLYKQKILIPKMIREERNLRLSECDWTQHKDIPEVVSQKWIAYRQALRDIPQQSGFPENVVWPEKP